MLPDFPRPCLAGEAAAAWFVPQVVISTGFSAGCGARAWETQHHGAETDQPDGQGARVQAGVPMPGSCISQGLCYNSPDLQHVPQLYKQCYHPL